MSAEYSLELGFEALEIDDDVRAALRSLKPLVAREFPGVMAAFYERFDAFAATGDTPPDMERTLAARAMLARHWATIAEAEFGDRFVASVRTKAETALDLGMPQQWRAAAFAQLLSGLIEKVIAEAWPKWSLGGAGADRTAASVRALIKAAILDMDVSTELYASANARNSRELFQGMAERFEANLSPSVTFVADAARGLEAAALGMAATAERTSERSTAVAIAAEQATANVSIVAASAEQMGKSVTEIAHQVGHSTAIAGQAVARAQSANATIENLARSAEKIGEIVELISDIAAQTNLLALNATIESARAGEAGRGFAVVASEVKNLATQTAKATEDIAAQVEGMQAIARDSAEAIVAITAIIDEMNAVSVAINAAVEQQSAATQEIARNTYEAATGAQDVSRAIGDVQEGASQAGAASAEVVSASQALGDQARTLRSVMETFLQTVRAA